MESDNLILVAAGGTGGHLFPASALASALAAKGARVRLATDERAMKFTEGFPAEAVHEIDSGTPTGGGFGDKMLALLKLANGVLESFNLCGELKPRAIVAFGGYPTVPPALGANLRGVPLVLHEQNAVIGRANRFLAGRAKVIASGFPTLDGLPIDLKSRVAYVGNPMRPAVLEAARVPYPGFDDQKLRLLVTGGSQGARVFSDVVPEAMALLNEAERARIVLTQQVREEDLPRVKEAYAKLKIAAEVSPFFADLPKRIASAHLVIGRSGASTVSELALIGRPSILVPFPHALDADQAANAAHLSACNAAEVVRQINFTPAGLADRLRQALAAPQDLTKRAQAARSVGVSDAADRLAFLTLQVAGMGETQETPK
ncbi:UDP-N-acetylglucosamine-N-acetylmuramylpentapeptide N-acetylglucosamine transferase [Rhodoblastus acidophilus]|uniref:UDP-N-acetylglucosamine--N-acetylmuramyl-(pentapeptide) pyrophosphoryl-undecaprenol N-acetylglucosamine transferase n=1 Tax=Rhodoblastus acidophilus TaxID=1074 RepID=A0A212RXV1_RHOAC|nr:UDP-N-acetylglucosamine--N-acetylmuramyl-(pentapeptide) pyrophosphoryl-undecaprenol N-acetylglucosamine transferase [Rhodoblastus acidophilus]MCW2315255.1 UDP-N-acetylglucosamine--N-acetylmuramyl-(pentapeptide) pyrophosphoryl-undecaprenol N-acetylglucosamine transferase [Rhodoblastus acidophilus]PPQ38428.1 UDP-N-acetylglucosamine--N-acetylmuramyl-(pentapeptide) pyrophosphoryl-undecaprenol N-acetylglucosamine transferase [Rhodoblastus acidophilus]RAI17266.1 UDP-N-acetylglucosamine--N-acetylmur